MLKKQITYTDCEGKQRTDTFYFNLSKAELIKMQFSAAGGLKEMMERAVNESDNGKLIEVFEDLIRRSYGVKTEDNLSFVKKKDGKELAEAFMQTDAYSELFMELVTDENAAAAFINGVIPPSLAAEVAAQRSIPAPISAPIE